MTIERGEFDALSLADLEELAAAQVPEGLRLEYKRGVYGNSDGDKREFLKDVTAFANSHGGQLILGIEERNAIATQIIGVECSDTDAEILRMEQMLRSGIEPPISGVRIKAILVDSNRNVFVLRIPRSWHPPHRVVAKKSNRFYVRHSAGVHEPSIEELRALFNQSSTALEQARHFRDERIAALCAGEGNRPLVSGGRLFLHILPTAASSGMVNLDIEEVYTKRMAFHPIGSMSMSPRFNYHGFINERGGDQNHGYTQIFRNGCLEATMGGIVRENNGRRGIAGASMEGYIFEVFSPYIYGLRDIGVPPPLIVMFTLEGVGGAHYYVRRNLYGEYGPPLPDHILRLPEGFLEDYGDDVDHHRAVRPAFDALWNAIGYAGSQFFNAEGLWVGAQA
jgi:hypothetical protein